MSRHRRPSGHGSGFLSSLLHSGKPESEADDSSGRPRRGRPRTANPRPPRAGLTITIDGPAGTGKSTAARGLAKQLGYLYLDTGAMYRAAALKALRAKIPLTNKRVLTKLANAARITFRVDPGHRVRVLLDGKDVSEEIRRPEISEAASVVATIPGVRRALVRQQQRIGAQGRVVAEGRDTGTVVFPRAELKFFLTADASERARRRWRELRDAGHAMSYKEVLLETKRRDRRDRERMDSPLVPAKRAIRVNNTRLQSSQVLDTLMDYVHRIQRRVAGGCFDRRPL